MKYSFSGLDQFKKCPRKFKAKYVDYTYTEPKSDQQNWGIRVHTHLEARFKDNTPLPPELTTMVPIIDVLAKAPGDIYVEQKLAINQQLQPVAYMDRSAHLRTIIDVTKVNNDSAFIGDYKTGKIHYEYDQLAISAIVLMVNFPQVNSVLGMFFWNKVGKRTKRDFPRAKMGEIWQPINQQILMVESALEADNFPPKPTPLCGWCHLKTCEHCPN